MNQRKENLIGLTNEEVVKLEKEYGKNEINKKFNKHYQMLQSYMLKFNFTTPSGILNYLNGCCFSLENKN